MLYCAVRHKDRIPYKAEKTEAHILSETQALHHVGFLISAKDFANKSAKPQKDSIIHLGLSKSIVNDEENGEDIERDVQILKIAREKFN